MKPPALVRFAIDFTLTTGEGSGRTTNYDDVWLFLGTEREERAVFPWECVILLGSDGVRYQLRGPSLDQLLRKNREQMIEVTEETL
jgi:hypothetical protein